MWRSSLLGLLLTAWLPSIASAEICLPGIFDDGSRVNEARNRRILWLELLLRQHEVCWRRPAVPGEHRVFVFGNSGVYGFPHFADQTAVAMVNQRFAEEGFPAHLYNVAMVWASLTKDALMVREALAYDPDVIVYAAATSDFRKSSHFYKPLYEFFHANARALERFAAEHPPGLDETLAIHAEMVADHRPGERAWRGLRQLGSFVRAGVGEAGRRVRQQWFPDLPRERPPQQTRTPTYDCDALIEALAKHWNGWQEWSLLPYLEALKRERGIEVLVVNWPIRFEPNGECYSRRSTYAFLREYNAWLAEQTAARGLHYLDLHNLLLPEEFEDSIHLAVSGQRRTAMHLQAALREIVPAADGP